MAQLGRALRSGRRGRKFESCHADESKTAFHFFDEKLFLHIWYKACTFDYDGCSVDLQIRRGMDSI